MTALPQEKTVQAVKVALGSPALAPLQAIWRRWFLRRQWRSARGNYQRKEQAKMSSGTKSLNHLVAVHLRQYLNLLAVSTKHVLHSKRVVGVLMHCLARITSSYLLSMIVCESCRRPTLGCPYSTRRGFSQGHAVPETLSDRPIKSQAG
jgi:hypothetical protein